MRGGGGRRAAAVRRAEKARPARSRRRPCASGLSSSLPPCFEPSLVLLPLSNLGNMRSRHRAKVAGSSHAGLLCCPSSRSQSSFFVRRSDQCCRIAFVAVSRRDAVEPSFFCCPTSRVGVCVSLPSSSSSFRRLQLRPPSSLHPFPSPPCVHVLILHYAAWPRISNVLFSSLPGCTSGHDC